MATYTVTGHIVGRPLDTNISENTVAQMLTVGVGGSITMTLPGPEDTRVKAHGALK